MCLVSLREMQFGTQFFRKLIAAANAGRKTLIKTVFSSSRSYLQFVQLVRHSQRYGSSDIHGSVGKTQDQLVW